MDSVLPTEKTLPLLRLQDYLILLYGVPKIGKSTFASRMEDPLFLAFESGLNALEVYQVPITSWMDAMAAGAELAKSDKFKTIVWDTVDQAYQMCLDHVCAAQGIRHPSDLEYGKGWHLVTQEFSRLIVKMSKLGRGMVLISHSQDIEITTPTKKLTKAVPTLSGKARETVLALSDIILYAEMMDTDQGSKRILHAAPSEAWEAGDRTGRLPAELPLSFFAVRDEFAKGAEKGAEAA